MNAACTGKTVRSLENTYHTWAPQRCIYDKTLYKSTFTFTFTMLSVCYAICESETFRWSQSIAIYINCSVLVVNGVFDVPRESGGCFDRWEGTMSSTQLSVRRNVSRWPRPRSLPLSLYLPSWRHRAGALTDKSSFKLACICNRQN